MGNYLEDANKNKIISKKNLLFFSKKYSCLIGILIILIIFFVAIPGFANILNLISILRLISVFTILGMGEAIVMSMRGIDLSIGTTAGFCSYLYATFLASGYSISMSLLITLTIGILIGFFNAIIISWLGINALVVTLGTMFMLMSIAMIMSNGGYSIYLFGMTSANINIFLNSGKYLIAGIFPISVIVMILVSIISYSLMQLTIIGRYFYSIGENVKAAYLSGIKVKPIFGLGFLISGFFAAIAGILLVLDSGVGTPPGGPGYLLEALAVATLSTAIFGEGEINIKGVFVGAIFMGALSNTLVLIGIDPGYEFLFKGLIILIGMALGTLFKKESK